MTLTLDQFSRMIPRNRQPSIWYTQAMELFPKYGITTTRRIAGFMAQCAHESADFTALEENLNYSVEALRRVFPRYFRTVNPAEYARNPQKLANYVYMDKYRTASGALGNIHPGDGWRFRGRGIKQLTGRSNYTAFGRSIGMTAEQAADYVATPRGAMESALWFWDRANLNRVADADDIVRMTRIINGGEIGLADRRARYEAAKRILSASSPQQPAQSTNLNAVVLRPGSKGETVRMVQRELRIVVDGDYGRNTAAAVRSWQNINKYIPTGELTQQQLNQLLRR